MSLWQRIYTGIRRFGRGVRSLFSMADAPKVIPAASRGAKDTLSSDLGDKSGWLGRNFIFELSSDIQTAVLTDSFLLRAMHDYERLARQGGIALEPATGEGFSPRKAKRALKEVNDFLENILPTYGNDWQDLFFMSVLSSSVFHNFAIELVWQGGQPVNMDLLPWGSLVQIVDDKGKPLGWIQFDHNYKRTAFALSEIVHGTTNRWAGDRYGTPELAPVAGQDGDLQAFRQVEGLLGKQAEQGTFPYTIINFGTENSPVLDKQQQSDNEAMVEGMVRNGTIVGNGQVKGQVLEPVGMDLSPLVKHWKERTVVPSGRSLLSLGLPEGINVATAEVIAAQEAQTQKAIVMSTASSWRQMFKWILFAKNIPGKYAPMIVPGEPSPVRREKKGKHFQGLFKDGIAFLDEARRANALPPATDEQKERSRKLSEKTAQPKEDSEDRKEDRADKRTK